MKTILPIILGLCLFGSSLQGFTHTQLLDAINFARTNPSDFAETIRKSRHYWNTNTNDWFVHTKEVDCFKKSYNWLKTEAPILPPYIESPVAVLAAYKHSKWIADTGAFSHKGENGSYPKDRLISLGTFDSGSWGLNENIAGAKPRRTNPTDWVFQWIVDCGGPPRGHRDNIFSKSVTQYGCAEVTSTTTGWVYTTCVGCTAMTFRPEVKAQTALFIEAGL